MDNPKVYDCFVEIVGDEELRQQIVDVVSKHNGSGEWIDDNRREYGGYITNNTVIEAEPGELSNDDGATIKLFEGYSTFHSHPSGIDSNNGRFSQPPSDIDITNAKGFTSYVFGRNNGKVYIYNAKGILSTLPHKRFISFKK